MGSLLDDPRGAVHLRRAVHGGLYTEAGVVVVRVRGGRGWCWYGWGLEGARGTAIKSESITKVSSVTKLMK